MFLARASIALVVGYRHENIEEATRLIWDAACAFIAKPAVWAAIEDVAALLLLHSVLGEDELRRLLDPVRRPLPSLPDPVWQPSLFDPVPMIATGRTPSQPVVRANPTVPSTPAAKPAFRPAIATTPAASEAKGVIQLVLVVLAAVAVLALVGSNDEQRRQQQWRDVQRAMHANDAAPSSSGSARP